jgi:hypothetical protein
MTGGARAAGGSSAVSAVEGAGVAGGVCDWDLLDDLDPLRGYFHLPCHVPCSILRRCATFPLPFPCCVELCATFRSVILGSSRWKRMMSNDSKRPVHSNQRRS